MHDCNSQYIISFYGAFISDPNICICMEFMDKGSLDGIYKKIGPIDIDVVGKVALAVLEGLTYLYDVHRIIHRGECFVASILTTTRYQSISRHQAVKHPMQFEGAHQDLRLRCIRRAHQLHRRHIRRHVNVHERAFVAHTAISRLTLSSSLSVYKAPSIRSNPTFGRSVSH